MASRLRKTYVWDALLRKMVAKPVESATQVHDIMPDLPDFVSTVDGRVVHGRRGLREHNRELGVTNPADFTDHWKKFQRNREQLFTGQDNSTKRTEAIVRAFHKLEGRNW